MTTSETLTNLEFPRQRDGDQFLATAGVAAAGTEVDALGNEEEFSFVRQAQMAFEVLEADLTAEDRYKALIHRFDQMIGQLEPANVVQSPRPSYEQYRSAYITCHLLHSRVEEIEDDEDPRREGLKVLEPLMIGLLRLARAEAADAGLDPDDLERAWLEHFPLPHGSPTVSVSQ